MFPHTGLAALPRLRDYRSRRIASQDRTGGNRDWIDVAPGERRTLVDVTGAGCIRHIWMTMLPADDSYYRRIVLRFTWDDAGAASIECPVGDFFGLGHARRKNFVTAVNQMSPQDGRGFNSWWPMPFRRRCHIEVENQGAAPHTLYYYFDYEEYDSPAALDGLGFLHVQWRRENPTRGWGDEYAALWKADRDAWMKKTWFGEDPRSRNADGCENYVMLAAEGDGVYCGGHLNIDIFRRQKNDWYGEGDDMVFIDDAVERTPHGLAPKGPPTLHGTGTEDWCNTAFGPHEEYCAPYHGILLYSGTESWKWRGKQSVYRYYIEDSIRFRSAILATIEHGHANKLHNDYSSTAYYYLREAQAGGPPLPPVEARLPRADEGEYEGA